MVHVQELLHLMRDEFLRGTGIRMGCDGVVAACSTFASIWLSCAMMRSGDYFERQCLDVAQPAVTYAGVTICIEIARHSALRNLGVAVHCGGTAGPGLAASIHVSFASPAAIILEHLLNSVGAQRDILLEPVKLRYGVIATPAAPGIGVVETSEAPLAQYPSIPGTGEVR